MESAYEALSTRGQSVYDFKSQIGYWTAKAREDVYTAGSNPGGIVNMGYAENVLCEDLWQEKLNEPGYTDFTTDMMYYFDYRGKFSFRKALAEFLTERLHSVEPLSPDNVVVTSGVGAALDMLAHLVGDPGDCFLNLAPYYHAIERDFTLRSQIACYNVQMPPKGEGRRVPWSFDVDILEKAMDEAKRQGESVRAILVLSPQNPTGYILPTALIQEVLEFGCRHDIHVIMDEIYALSVFDEKAKFQSVVTLDSIPNKNKVHLVWGVSKDFGLSGMRCGMIYTWNSAIIKLASKFLFPGAVSSMVQDKLTAILQDKEWLDGTYFPTNYARMRESHAYACQRLREMGVFIHPSNATFFIWADFSKFLDKQSHEAEMDLFKRFTAENVLIIPGQVFFTQEVGWFRVTFTFPVKHLEEGFNRLFRALGLDIPERK